MKRMILSLLLILFLLVGGRLSAMAEFRATPSPTPTLTPSPSPSPTPTPMPTATPSPIPTASPMPTPTPVPTPTPSPTPTVPKFITPDGKEDENQIILALAKYKSVELDEGIFDITAEFQIPSGRAFHGQGKYATILKPSANLYSTVLIQNSTNITLWDFAIDGSLVTAKAVAGIHIYNSSYVRGYNLYIYDFATGESNGIGIGLGSHHNQFDYIRVARAGDEGISINGSNYNTIDHYISENNAEQGIVVRNGASYNTVAYSEFFGSLFGISNYWQPGSTDAVAKFNTYSYNVLWGNGANIQANGNFETGDRNLYLTFSFNRSFDAVPMGNFYGESVRFTDVAHSLLMGNTHLNNPGGVRLYDSGHNKLIGERLINTPLVEGGALTVENEMIGVEIMP